MGGVLGPGGQGPAPGAGRLQEQEKGQSRGQHLENHNTGDYTTVTSCKPSRQDRGPVRMRSTLAAEESADRTAVSNRSSNILS